MPRTLWLVRYVQGLDERLELSELIAEHFSEARRGKNTQLLKG